MTISATTATLPTYRVHNPATDSLIESFVAAEDAHIEQLLTSAHSAFTAWKQRPINERARVIKRAGEIFAERKEELAQIITQEMGKGLSEALGEVELCAGIFDYYADEATNLTEDRVLAVPVGDQALVEKLPIGVILGIMPWNYPYYQVLRFAIPNLVLGNTVIIKPAEICPRSAMVLNDIFAAAGVPDGAYSTAMATHAQISTMIDDDRVRGVSVTGSERAGIAIGMQAAKNLKKAVLELGGADAYIILDTENVAESAALAWRTRISNMGQACNSNKRIIVLDDIYEEFVAEMTALASGLRPGDPQAELPGTYNPLASVSGAAAVDAQVLDAVEKGATVHAGGVIERQGSAYYPPTVLTGVRPGMRAATEEVFGPVAVIYSVATEEEAIALANDCEYGLGGAVFSSDTERALRVARQLDSGMTHVNTPSAFGAQLPFGGVKKSGIGRELGPEGMDEFANKRLLYISA